MFTSTASLKLFGEALWLWGLLFKLGKLFLDL
jgi:hypothetical protein